MAASKEHLVAKQMIAGAISGGIADAAMYPMMTVKSRLMVPALISLPIHLRCNPRTVFNTIAFQVQGGNKAALYSYNGPLQAFQHIIAREGLRTLYKATPQPPS